MKNRLYEKYKNKVVKLDGTYGNVAGFTESNLLLAISESTKSSFSLDELDKKEFFIAEEFLEDEYQYSYIDESQIIKYIKKVETEKL